MSNLSPREQRLIALGILMGLLALAWLAVASPIISGFSVRRDARATASDTLSHNARLISSFSALRAQGFAVRRAQAAWAIQSASPAIAAELARERVSRAVADSGGSLQALRDEPGLPGVIRLQGDTQIGLEGLQALLHRLEDQAPYAAVNKLSVAASDTPAAQRSSSLQVRFDVSFNYIASR